MLERRPPGRYRRDPIGWLLWATMGPPVRVRLKTMARFLPSSLAAPALLVQEFDRLQAAQLDCLAHADGLPLSRVRVTSPFNAHVRYNVYACFSILPRHQHRHLWQAGRGWGEGGSAAREVREGTRVSASARKRAGRCRFSNCVICQAVARAAVGVARPGV